MEIVLLILSWVGAFLYSVVANPNVWIALVSVVLITSAVGDMISRMCRAIGYDVGELTRLLEEIKERQKAANSAETERVLWEIKRAVVPREFRH